MTGAPGDPVGRGPLVGLDVRVKIVVTLALVIGCVSAPPRAAPLLGYLCLVLTLLAAAAVPPRWLLVRLGAAAALALLVIVGALAGELGGAPGEAGLGAGGLTGGPVAGAHRERVGLLLGRALVGAGAVSWLLATTGLPRLLRGLERLRLPAEAADLLALTHRYGRLLAEQAGATRTAVLARGGGGGAWLRDAGTTGRIAGALYLRAAGRAERVHAAMLARGLEEARPAPPPRPLKARDLALGTLLLGLAVLPRVAL